MIFLMCWALTLPFALEHFRIAQNGDPEGKEKGEE
jgi:hypothetical protein